MHNETNNKFVKSIASISKLKENNMSLFNHLGNKTLEIPLVHLGNVFVVIINPHKMYIG